MSGHPQATQIEKGLNAPHPFPPGASLSLVQREEGAWDALIDRLAFQIVSDELARDELEATGDRLANDGDLVWVTLFIAERDGTYTRVIGHVAHTHLPSRGRPSTFDFVDGIVIDAINIAGIHL